MLFKMLLYLSLAIFSLGMVYKFYTWFSRSIGLAVHETSTAQRFSAAVGGILKTVFSADMLILLKVFVLDVVLQIRTLREDRLRWSMHVLIYWGFMVLLLMHALEKIVSQVVFSDYYATVFPYSFVRDAAGVMVLAGLALAVLRRFVFKPPRFKSNAMDGYAIAIVAVIMVSGVLLEGLKITSHGEFTAMQEDYAGLEDETQIQALESAWVADFGLVAPGLKAPLDAELVELGRELHVEYCAECHSAAQWAFGGYATARVLTPAALALDRAGGVNFLYYVHILACFVGLAYLPFSKMFHLVATPISLLANAVMDPSAGDGPNVLTRQLVELDACTHCGTCSRYCSAMMASTARGNACILPSEKMSVLKAMAGGQKLDAVQANAIREGVYLCTNCDRCTVVCPAGINLRQLWIGVREQLIQHGEPEPLMLAPFSLVRGLNQNRLPADVYARPLQTAQTALAGDFEARMDAGRTLDLSHRDNGNGNGILSAGVDTFAACFGCQTCTTVCPVVQNYENPVAALGMLPHQIMYSLSAGLTRAAAGAGMLWSCLTCYQCQEQCPQQVPVTDVLYELKQLAVKNLEQRSESGRSVPAGAVHG